MGFADLPEAKLEAGRLSRPVREQASQVEQRPPVRPKLSDDGPCGEDVHRFRHLSVPPAVLQQRFTPALLGFAPWSKEAFRREVARPASAAAAAAKAPAGRGRRAAEEEREVGRVVLWQVDGLEGRQVGQVDVQARGDEHV